MENKSIGRKIADARKLKNLSQAQLGEQLFISPQAVGKWERGESFPDIITLERLAVLFGVDLNFFSESFRSTVEVSEQNEIVNKATETVSPLKQKNKLRWDMSRGNWVDADFSGLTNLNEKFSSSNLQRCSFKGSDLSALVLKNNNVESCDFSQSNLSESQIIGSNLSKNNFTICNLKNTEFTGSYVAACDFTGSDFCGMHFQSGGFEKNKLHNAVWNQTRFNATYIADLVFEGNFVECSFEDCHFKQVTFQNAVFTNTFFKCRSLKKIKFIDCKADRLTYAFLKSNKADLSGITCMDKDYHDVQL